MLKSVLAFIFFTLLGFYYSGQIGKKQKTIESLIRFNNAFLINVQYSKKPITEFINEYSDKDLSDVLKVYKHYIEKGSDLDFKGLLPKELNDETVNYFSTLGISDSATQVDFLKSYCNLFCNELKKFNDRIGNKKTLCGKLGILSGAGAFVLLL